MVRTLFFLSAACVFVLFGEATATGQPRQAGGGGPFEIPIDQSQSSITAQLCVLGQCDSDSSPVVGFMGIELGRPVQPTTITLYDFDFSLTDTIDLFIEITVFGIPVGTISATAIDLNMTYADPGVPFGPTPIVDGAFSFADVPTNTAGIVSYNATGVVCVALESEGQPCAATINLADQGTQMGSIEGTIVVEDGIATVVFSPSIEVVLVEGVAVMTIDGTVVGSAPVSIVGDGDYEGDGDVDMADCSAMSVCFGTSPLEAGCEAFDMDGNGMIDLADWALFVSAMTGPL